VAAPVGHHRRRCRRGGAPVRCHHQHRPSAARCCLQILALQSSWRVPSRVKAGLRWPFHAIGEPAASGFKLQSGVEPGTRRRSVASAPAGWSWFERASGDQSLVDAAGEKLPVHTTAFASSSECGRLWRPFLPVRNGLASPPVDRTSPRSPRRIFSRVMPGPELSICRCGVGDESAALSSTRRRVAVAQFRRAERIERLGVGRHLGHTKGLEFLATAVSSSASSQRQGGRPRVQRQRRQS